MQIPDPPGGLTPEASRLWASVAGEFDLTEAELALLGEACRTLADLGALAAVVEAEGHVVDGKPHAALVEARQLRLVLARLIASLRLPDADDVQPQRRGMVRVPYVPGGVRRASSSAA